MARTLAFSGGSTFTFLTSLTPDGFPLNAMRHVEEPLEAAGVYGRRWRKVSQAFPVFELRTLAEAADFAAAVALAESYLAAVLTGQTATLTIDGVALASMHVSGVVPVPRPGQPVGAGASASSAAHVVATWSIEFPAP